MTDDPALTGLASRLERWLGQRGADFFSGLKRDHGRINVVISGKPPHAVHFREGMQVRNWLREQPECRAWDAHMLDKMWVPLVERALGLTGP